MINIHEYLQETKKINNDIDIENQENIIHTETVYKILKTGHKLNKITLFNMGTLSSASRIYFNIHNRNNN